MGSFEEGKIYSIADEEEWSKISPEAGLIIEVSMEDTDVGAPEEAWGAFFIKKVIPHMDGSLLLDVYFLGCEHGGTAATLELRFAGVEPQLHICHTRPCIDFSPTTIGSAVVHVTAFRLWTHGNFDAGYVPSRIQSLLKKWVKETVEGTKPKPRTRKPKEKEKAAPGAGKTPRAKAGGKPKTGNAGARKKGEEDGEAGKDKITEEQRAALKERLSKVRRRHLGTEESPGEVEDLVSDSAEDGEAGSEAESLSYAPTDPLDTGTKLKGPAKKKKRDGNDPKEKGLDLVPYKGTKERGTKNLSGQLISQALAISRARQEAEAKRKKKKKGGSGALDALRRILKGGDDPDEGDDKKKKKKKTKKKKDKKRKKRLENGVIRGSSGTSCESSGVSVEESSSDTDLEAPMRKKTRDRPGSVLAMLTDHVRQQMDQDALADISRDGNQVTSGVKIVSYFNQHVKTAFPAHLRELREMFTLGSSIDLLRKGDIARVGDALAARFIALHQSLLDQGWGTARHMEIYPLEESSAAGPSMVLASRKHSRLVDRVQGKGAPTWPTWGYPKGKGRGRGDGAASYEGNKGKKGKGENKGKGKGKNSGAVQEKGSSDWAKAQDKGDK